MALHFNTLLAAAGVDPKQVLLMRHQDGRATLGRTPFQLWRDAPAEFEAYQRLQSVGMAQRFTRRYWASFVGAPPAETLFVGLYEVGGRRLNEAPLVGPHDGLPMPPGAMHVYDLAALEALRDFAGLLYVEWGAGLRARVQQAERHDKRVLELRRELKEPDFPGYLAFMAQLSELEGLPATWAAALALGRGVYLLSCPRTNEQYVGAALSGDGFLGRWLDYARSGHGGNAGLKSRDASDYRVSILEVAGSAATSEDILAMETRWKAKLQSREMGLNRN